MSVGIGSCVPAGSFMPHRLFILFANNKRTSVRQSRFFSVASSHRGLRRKRPYDPRIHPFCKKMDCRVKPGNDAQIGSIRPAVSPLASERQRPAAHDIVKNEPPSSKFC